MTDQMMRLGYDFLKNQLMKNQLYFLYREMFYLEMHQDLPEPRRA